MPLSRIKREFRDDLRKNLLAQRLQQHTSATQQSDGSTWRISSARTRTAFPRSPRMRIVGNRIAPKADDQAKAPRGPAQGDSRQREKRRRFAAMAKRYSRTRFRCPGGRLGFVRRGMFCEGF